MCSLSEGAIMQQLSVLLEEATVFYGTVGLTFIHTSARNYWSQMYMELLFARTCKVH